MTNEQKPKTRRPPIGTSIPAQFQTFGSSNGDEEQELLTVSEVQNSKISTAPTAGISAVQTSDSLATQNAEISTVQQSSNPGGKKSKHPDWKQQTVYLPPPLIRWLRMQAPNEEREISEIVTEALEQYRHTH